MSRKDFRAYIGLAAVLLAQTVAMAAGEPLPIKKISVDASKQLVVEFGGKGEFPAVPHILDLPGPNHRVVLDFSQASLDKASLPGAEELSTAVGQALPFVKSVRYSNLENAPEPTARIVLDLPEEMKVKPRVVKLEEGIITISLSEDAVASEPSGTANGAPSVADVAAAAAPAAAAPTETAAATGNGGNAPAGGWDWSSGANAGQAAPASTAVAAADAAPLKGPIDTTSATADTAPSADITAAAAAAAAAQAAPEAPVATAVPTPVTTTEVTPATVTPQATAPAAAPAQTAAAEPTNGPGPEALGMPAEPTATTAPAAGAADKKLAAVKLYNAAVQLHLQGKLTEAIAQYKQALEGNPSLAEAHSNLGLIYNQQHNYAQALAEFRKSLAINPKDAITYNGIGAALRAEKDLQGAIKNWQTAVSLDPKLATAHYNLGTAYEIDKEYDKALGSYQSAVKNDYRLGEAFYRMGLIMERRHRNDDAAQHFQEALKVSADSEYSEDARQRLAYLKQKNKTK